jgi:predicted dehydrogenase
LIEKTPAVASFTAGMISRRRFILNSSIASAALGFPAITRCQSPNSKINIAFIGTGGRGGGNLKTIAAAKEVNVVALCDVNETNLYQAAGQHAGAAKFKDFRRLYDEQKDIDAVVVSTTEHTHAYAVLPALRMRKPVYCEKPLTHHVHEAQLIIEATRTAKVATQMGTQIHGMPNYRRVVEAIQTGAIGKVTECHVCVSRAWGLQSAEDAKKNGDIIHITDRPKVIDAVPDNLDWDLWLGPAPHRPFSNVYFPGPKWYRWWDFGNGTMSDLGSHWNDLPWWALKLDAPLTIESTSPMGPAHSEIAPATMTTVYEYGPRGDMPACKVYWHQGATKPEIWKDPAISPFGNGVLFIGDKGKLISDYSKHKVLIDGYTPPPKTIPDSPGQHEQWIQAVLHSTPTDSPFDTYSGPLTIANHLGNVAYRVGKKLEWDAASYSARNAPEAAAFLKREPRAGWRLA